MKEFLDNYGDMYVTMKFPEANLSDINSYADIEALLYRIERVAVKLSEELDFLEAHEEDILGYIDSLFSVLEIKTASLKNAIEYSSKIKFESGDVPVDIRVLDFSMARYDNCSYSIYDDGVVMEDTIRIFSI